MEMLNRAFEEAADFKKFKRELLEAHIKAPQRTNKPPKRPGENRQEYRARLREEARSK